MTTIAYRNGVLAADTQLGFYGLTLTFPNFKLFYAGPYAVGVSGDARYVEKLTRWIENGEEFAELWSDEWDAMVMNAEGKLGFVIGPRIVWSSLPFMAQGSGSCLALGAMEAGKSAVEAVRIAAKWDEGTNDKVETITVESLRKRLAE